MKVAKTGAFFDGNSGRNRCYTGCFRRKSKYFRRW